MTPKHIFIDIDGTLHSTAATRGIHRYAMSWATPTRRLARWLSWHGMRRAVDALLRLRGRILPRETM